jgi:Tfp pilus assembly protein PilO
MAINIRSEVQRPTSLILLGVAVLGWLLLLATFISYSGRQQAAQDQVGQLQRSETDLRNLLTEQQQTSGNVADLRAQITAEQQSLAELNR